MQKDNQNNEEQNNIEMNEVPEQDAETQEQQNIESEEIDYKEKYLRLLSEHARTIKQKDEELKSMAQYGNKSLLNKVIDIVDDIESGLNQESVSEETKTILQMLHQKVMHILTIEGVTEIPVKSGDEYSAEKCEVLTMIEDPQNKGRIAHIARKGYMIGERVLRTAKVVVGK